jgi:hypothetical protein
MHFYSAFSADQGPQFQDSNRTGSTSGQQPLPPLPSFEFTSLSFPETFRDQRAPGRQIMRCESHDARERFVRCRDSLPPSLLAFVDQYSATVYEQQNTRLFLTEDGLGGVGVRDGELISLFSLPGARYGSMLIERAIAEGASWLYCLDGRGMLQRLYARHGFEVVSRDPWNEAYAPINWDYERFGRPDCIRMELRGKESTEKAARDSRISQGD